jgi:hypothetical protein
MRNQSTPTGRGVIFIVTNINDCQMREDQYVVCFVPGTGT